MFKRNATFTFPVNDIILDVTTTFFLTYFFTCTLKARVSHLTKRVFLPRAVAHVAIQVNIQTF